VKSALAMAMVALVPLGALAQVSYSHAQLTDDAPYSRHALRVCTDRNEQLADRKADLDQDKRDIDRESDAIARGGAMLADELRNLDSTDSAAVAAYNARSAGHNRFVAEHNARVADMNGAAAALNGDSADLMAYCDTLVRR